MDITSTNLLTIYKNKKNASPPVLKTYYLSRKQEAQLEAEANKVSEGESSSNRKIQIFALGAASLLGLGIFLSRKQIMFNSSEFFTYVRRFIAKVFKLNTIRLLRIKDDFRLNKEVDIMRINEVYNEGNDRQVLNLMHIVTKGLSKKESLKEDEKNLLIFYMRELLNQHWIASSVSRHKTMISGMHILPDIMRMLKREGMEEIDDFIAKLVLRVKDKKGKISERTPCLDKLIESKILNKEHIESLLRGEYKNTRALEGLILVLKIAKEQAVNNDTSFKKLINDFFNILKKSNEREKYILINAFIKNVNFLPPENQKDVYGRLLGYVLNVNKNKIFDDPRFIDVPYAVAAKYLSSENADIREFGYKNVLDFYQSVKERSLLLSNDVAKISQGNGTNINALKSMLFYAGKNLIRNHDFLEFENICISSIKELLELSKNPALEEKYKLIQETKNSIKFIIAMLSESRYPFPTFLDKLHRLYPMGNMPEKVGLNPSEVYSLNKLVEQKRKLNQMYHPDNFPYSKIKRMENEKKLKEINYIFGELIALCKRSCFPEPVKAITQ